MLLYTRPLIIAISSWWVDLETDTFFRDPTTPAAPQFCLREKSSCRAKQWEESVRERKKWQRFLPQCSVTGGSILDFLSWFWCLCHHDYHHWIIYEWDCLWDSAKKKKALPPIHSGSEGLPVPRCWPERHSFSQDFGCPCPLHSFAMGLSGLKSR